MILNNNKINNFLIYWLTVTFLLIILMIIIGGLTRLTDSGLSITEWELFKGILPPLNQSDWNRYFDLYKQIPQYELLNSSMSLEEFKVIYFWEYIHRILGRLIGIVFLIPLIYLQFFTNLKFKELIYYYLILILICFQGFIGWYMVKSGLVDNVTVSHYRLSLHLCLALIITSMIFWKILCLFNNVEKSFFNFSKKEIIFMVLFFLIFLQIIIGAFVSGLDAGKIYQTWPLMGDNYFPDDIKAKNFSIFSFSEHSLVQFYHRNIAYLIMLTVFVLGIFIFKNKFENLYKPFSILTLVIFIQVFLGILTLLSDLNIYLASGHQITSVILLLSSLNLYFLKIK